MGVYTAKDYAEIIGALVKEWKVEGLTGISGASAKAQEYLCRLSERYLETCRSLEFFRRGEI